MSNQSPRCDTLVPDASSADAPPLATLRRRLLNWYRAAARPLPWRKSADPYQIWISEIMLQQTTVKAVVPYFERFLERFPDLPTLAAATEAEVLQFWEGLGYYSRGRNLLRAAQQVIRDHQGRFPSDLDTLQTLPGIGRYTAGAIASFAFRQPAPILEANTVRLHARLSGYDGDTRSRSGQLHLWNEAARWPTGRHASDINQALMELGATLCTPKNPRCPDCPLAVGCRARQQGRQSSIPSPVARPEVTQTLEATFAAAAAGRWLLRRYSADERWTGLWDFPRIPITSVPPDAAPVPSVLRSVLEESAARLQPVFNDTHYAGDVRQGEFLTAWKHSVTRYRISLWSFRLPEISLNPPVAARDPASPWGWFTLEEIAALPMPVTGRRLARKLVQSLL